MPMGRTSGLYLDQFEISLKVVSTLKHYVDTKPRLRCLWIYSQLYSFLREAVMSVLVTTIYGRWRGTITSLF